MEDGTTIEGSVSMENGFTWTNTSVNGEGMRVETWSGASDDMSETYMKQIQQFDQYFYYAIDHMGAAPGSKEASCHVSNECTQTQQKYCCANAVMTDDNGKENSIYRCINEKIADINMSMEMNGMRMAMKCVDKAFATALSMATATAVGLVAVNMF
jgi:hypothetical protein